MIMMRRKKLSYAQKQNLKVAGKSEADIKLGYQVEKIKITAANFLLPCNYPPRPELTEEELKSASKGTGDERAHDVKQAEMRRIAAPNWNEWEMLDDRLVPTRNVQAEAKYREMKRKKEGDGDFHHNMDDMYKKVTKKGAAKFEALATVIAQDKEKDALDAMLAGLGETEQNEALYRAEMLKKTVAVATVTFHDCLSRSATPVNRPQIGHGPQMADLRRRPETPQNPSCGFLKPICK